MATCTWCVNPAAEEDDETLCLLHQAEHDGLSVSELLRRDEEQEAEYRDTLN